MEMVQFHPDLHTRWSPT